MPPKLPPSSEVRARWSECLRACVGAGVGGGCLAEITDLSLVHGLHLCSVAASRILPRSCARLLIWWILLLWQLATRARATNSTAGPIATPSVDTPHSAHPHVQPPSSVGWCVVPPQTLPFSLIFPLFHFTRLPSLTLSCSVDSSRDGHAPGGSGGGGPRNGYGGSQVLPILPFSPLPSLTRLSPLAGAEGSGGPAAPMHSA